MKLFFVIFISAYLYSQTKVTKIHSISEIGGKDVQVSFDNFSEYPDICIDRSGKVWIAYTQYKDEKENIVLKQFNDMTAADSFIVSTKGGIEYRPRLFCDSQNKVWIVWAAKRNNNWDIYARYFHGEKLSNEIRLTNNDEIDIHPAISGNDDGYVWIIWESLRNGNFDIYIKKISEGKISEPTMLSNSIEMELRPVVLCYSDKIIASWDRQKNGNYQIIAKYFNGENWGQEIAVSPSIGFNMSPSLAVNNGRVKIAWHSNLQPNGKVGLIPWVYLCDLIDGIPSNIFTPANEGDWLKKGEDQGMEFPSVLFDSDGLFWVFSRASQSFFVQAVNNFRNGNGGKKSCLYKFDVEGWGGRGQFVKAALSKDGTIYSVRRDINYIYLNKFKTSVDRLFANNQFDDFGQYINFDKINLIEYKPSKNDTAFKINFPDNYKILFGDIHQHSSLSDGRGTVDECYTRSKYIYKYDFAALTDHEWFTGNLILPSEWEWIKIIGKQFDEPENFITFAAYEWTTPRVPRGFGHKNVYFSNWDKPIFSFNSNASNTKDLFRLLKENNAIAFPHHIGWTGTDWENHDEEAQPDVEIVSAHGAFEYLGNEPIYHRGGIPGNFVQDGLAKGLKFGLLGSSDGHGLRWHHGIGRKEDEWQIGLTGIITKNKDKQEIFNALKIRRVYATSGTKMVISFRVNDKWMGEEIVTSEPPKIDIEVIGTAPIKYVILLRDNEEILYLGKDIYEGLGVHKTYIDENLTEGKHWYYLRIIQEDNEMAWSSPVWVEMKK